MSYSQWFLRMGLKLMWMVPSGKVGGKGRGAKWKTAKIIQSSPLYRISNALHASLHSAPSPLFLSPLLHISAVSNCRRRAGSDTNVCQPVRTDIMSSAAHSVNFSLQMSSILFLFIFCTLLRCSCLTVSPGAVHNLLSISCLPASFDYPLPFFV